MISGLYTAASGMIAVESRQETVANNIANAATPGFKRQQPVTMGFYELFSGKLRNPATFQIKAAPGGGPKMVETYPDLRDGMLQHTENPLNLALQGPGYFVVDTPNGERYTRAGSFSMDGEGYLVDGEGHRVQSAEGQGVLVSGGPVNVAEDGTVSVAGQPSGRIRMVEFTNPKRLLRDGASTYRASREVEQQRTEAVDTRLAQGKLEMSNVQLPTEMVQLMLGARAYEANQRIMTTMDATLGRLIDQVAMPS